MVEVPADNAGDWLLSHTDRFADVLAVSISALHSLHAPDVMRLIDRFNCPLVPTDYSKIEKRMGINLFDPVILEDYPSLSGATGRSRK
jgi:hypothetical protein